MSQEKPKEKKEVIYFNCETELKNEFYRVAQQRGYSPGALFRAFMRKVVKSHNEEKINLGDSD